MENETNLLIQTIRKFTGKRLPDRKVQYDGL